MHKIFTTTCPVGLTYATCIIVEFPHSKVDVTGLPKTWFPITQVTWSFTTLLDSLNADTGSKENLKIRITRSQLPIQPAFAVTGHSAQGKTLPKVLVNLSEGGFGAYVAASRATSQEGLCLTQPVKLDELNKPLPSDLLIEVHRFEALEHNTYIRYGINIGNMVPVPDAEAERSVRTFTPKPKFDLTDEPSGVSAGTKRKATQDDKDPVSDTFPDATTHQPKKRMKVHNVGKNFVSKYRLLSPIPLQSPPGVGCEWSSTDWSCAYDSVFMVLFYAYRAGDNFLRQRCQSASPAFMDLTKVYDALGENDSNLFSRDLFGRF